MKIKHSPSKTVAKLGSSDSTDPVGVLFYDVAVDADKVTWQSSMIEEMPRAFCFINRSL